jgi:hypothetical protein
MYWTLYKDIKMSADNGIYILRTKDGYRVAECQAIENILWWPTCCENPNIQDQSEIYQEDLCFHEECANCGTIDPEWEQREEINPQVVFKYFHESEVFQTREEALEQADFFYCQANKDACCGVEYGIQFINGLEQTNFPKQ